MCIIIDTYYVKRTIQLFITHTPTPLYIMFLFVYDFILKQVWDNNFAV